MLKFYRHCGEGWGWSGEKDYVRDNVPHGDPHSVLHEKTLEEIIEELIRADNKVTRAAVWSAGWRRMRCPRAGSRSG